MDHNHYGLDGHPIYPRPGHFDHVTGQPLPTFRGAEKNTASAAMVLPLAIVMAVVGFALAYLSGSIG